MLVMSLTSWYAVAPTRMSTHFHSTIRQMADELIRATVDEWQRAKNLKRIDLDKELHDRLSSFMFATEAWMASRPVGDTTSLSLLNASLQAVDSGTKLWINSYLEHVT